MKLLRWQLGRQNSGYEIFPFFLSVIFDAYLLRYKSGSYIEDHTDPLPGRKHYRLNIILWNSSIGGEFESSSVIFETKRIKFFRPDISTHSVSNVLSGTRIVLSIGWSIIDYDHC